jgi:hypothetical protein
MRMLNLGRMISSNRSFRALIRKRRRPGQTGELIRKATRYI